MSHFSSLIAFEALTFGTYSGCRYSDKQKKMSDDGKLSSVFRLFNYILLSHLFPSFPFVFSFKFFNEIQITSGKHIVNGS